LAGPFSGGGAKIEPTDAIAERDPRGQEDDRDLARLRTTDESFGHLPAGSPRQIDMEQDHIRPLLLRERHSGRPVYGLDDPEQG
jgi:hypothetical protein